MTIEVEELLKKIERFVNIQNQRNLILEQHLSSFKLSFPHPIDHNQSILKLIIALYALSKSVIWGTLFIAVAIIISKFI